jgi:hypothetical protein
MNFLSPFLLGMALGLVPMASGSVALDDVRAADAAFAARAAELGHHEAFIEFLAADAVLFRPEAVAGQQWLATHESGGGQLGWSPAGVAVDCAGRLAITTGPWSYANADGGEPVVGHYLSVWRLGPDAQWQVVLDQGIDHAADVIPAVPLQQALSRLWADGGAAVCKGRAEAADLDAAELRLNALVARQGLARALQSSSVDGALVYRDDAAPAALGLLPATSDASFAPGTVAQPAGKVFEPGANLAVTHGTLLSADGANRALYVRVWIRERRKWQVAVDMVTPLAATAGGEP